MPAFIREQNLPASEALVRLAKIAKREKVPVHLCWQGVDVLHHNRYLAARLKQENLHHLLLRFLNLLVLDGLAQLIHLLQAV